MATQDGDKLIAEVEVGDLVMGYSEVAGAVSFMHVTATHNKLHETTLDVTIDGEVVHTTDEHPFFVIKDGEGEWVKAKDLQVGDVIFNTMEMDGIVEVVEVVDEPQTMYNLSVQLVASYFVGDGQWLVHNVDVYRFGDIPNPTSRLSQQPLWRRTIESVLLRIPAYRQRVADMHAHKWGLKNSPFVSLTGDLEAIRKTGDAKLASVIQGYPYTGIQAPTLYTYDVPESYLVTPQNTYTNAPGLEKEILFYGDNLGDYLESERPNPYKPGDVERFRPPNTPSSSCP